MEANTRSTLSEIHQDILSQHRGVTNASDKGDDGGGGSGMGAVRKDDSPSAGSSAQAPNIEPQTVAKLDEQSSELAAIISSLSKHSKCQWSQASVHNRNMMPCHFLPDPCCFGARVRPVLRALLHTPLGDVNSGGGTATRSSSAESQPHINPPSAGPGSSSSVCDLIRELSSTFDARFKQLGDEMQQVKWIVGR